MNKIRSTLAGIFSEKVYNGLWFSPEGEFVRSCLKMSQSVINGKVILELYKGKVYIVGRSADQSLYDQELVRYIIKKSHLKPPSLTTLFFPAAWMFRVTSHHWIQRDSLRLKQSDSKHSGPCTMLIHSQERIGEKCNTLILKNYMSVCLLILLRLHVFNYFRQFFIQRFKN